MPLLAQTVGVVDLQNRVLLDDAEQQQQAEAGEDLTVWSGEQQRQDAERHGQRQRDAES